MTMLEHATTPEFNEMEKKKQGLCIYIYVSGLLKIK